MAIGGGATTVILAGHGGGCGVGYKPGPASRIGCPPPPRVDCFFMHREGREEGRGTGGRGAQQSLGRIKPRPPVTWI